MGQLSCGRVLGGFVGSGEGLLRNNGHRRGCRNRVRKGTRHCSGRIESYDGSLSNGGARVGIGVVEEPQDWVIGFSVALYCWEESVPRTTSMV